MRETRLSGLMRGARPLPRAYSTSHPLDESPAVAGGIPFYVFHFSAAAMRSSAAITFSRLLKALMRT